MSMTTEQRTQIIEAVVGVFDAAPGATYLNELSWYAGHPAALVEDLTATGAFTAIYPTYLTNAEFAGQYISTLVGNTVPAEASAWAVEWMTAGLNNGLSRGQMIYQAINSLSNVPTTDATWGAAALQLQNKIAVAEYYSVDLAVAETDVAALQSVISDVDNTTDVSTPDHIQDVIDAAPGNNSGQTLTLTQNADAITGNAGDNIFVAPVTQNLDGSGMLANTFETGDVLDGGEGRNILRADLIETGSISDVVVSPAISATTANIQEVYFRAQNPQFDLPVNGSTIDAEKMAGVEQWWTDNSRSDIQIEDIRSDASETTFGMRQTDPTVGYDAYFNVGYLSGDMSATSSMTLNIYEGPLGSPNTTTQLENISVREITFTVGGVEYTLDTPEIRAADTWAALETALNAALDAIEGAEDIVLTNRGNGQFVFSSAAGLEFEVNEGEALVLSVTNNITVTNALTVGREEVVGLIETDVVLDAAGNGSQGGALNIGAMSGLRGIEEMNVTVDRDSHLTSMTSFNLTPGQFNNLRNGDANEFLQVINLASTGDNGNLTIGQTDPNAIDGRVQSWSVAGGIADGTTASGLINVREINGAGFAGTLNAAITMDDNLVGRYLEGAEGEVEFNFTASAGKDTFNIADLSLLQVSGDADFAMNVDMGAGDDILVMNVPFVNSTTVAGGAGQNVIKVAQSHGTTAGNTFEAFSGFQTYEVEGNVAATSHDFTSMTGISNVIIATTGGVSTQLIDLEAAQNVTVSGKNQTANNNNNAAQAFNVVRLTNDTGATRVVTLANTARVDATMTVNQLLIDATATGVSATRTLEIVSAGTRATDNVIGDIDAALVNTFRLTGTQDLTATITAAANSTAAAANRANLVVNAATLTGDLDLSIDGGVVSAADAGTASTVKLTGTVGAADRLTFDESNANNTLAITTDTTVAGFETVRFVDGNGVVDATNFSGVGTYDIEDLDGALTLDGLKGTEVINVNVDAAGNVAGNAMTFIAGGQSASSVLDLEFRDNDTVQVDNNTAFAVAEISARDFHTVSLDLGGYELQNEAYTFQLELQDADGDDADVAAALSAAADATGAYDAASVYARALVVAGGGDQGNAGAAGGVDSINLGIVSNVLSSIDLSDYAGQIALIVNNYADNVVDRNVTIDLNGYGANLAETLDTVDENIVTYKFSDDAAANTEDVVINGFAAFNDIAGVIDLTNLSVLDLSSLGVEGLADLKISAEADVDTFTAGAQAGILITSNEGLNFQIGLVGITLPELSNENFKFAV